MVVTEMHAIWHYGEKVQARYSVDIWSQRPSSLMNERSLCNVVVLVLPSLSPLVIRA